MDVPQQHLLSVWEAMRKAIFGGSDAAMLQGLSVSGVQGSSGCRVPADFAKRKVQGANGHQNKDWDWIQDALGATQIARLQARDMSDYMYVLASDEGLRDPQEKWDEIATEREKEKEKGKEKEKDGTMVVSGRVW